MKKFLSLVLAMIMTLSLVTISAGATEYKDLTDKDEIQYEEAVAVLNRIGVITGYEDGTFRPETELTRGAAAKIIVSLMIGPDAANALPNTTSPYPDVPAGHTFAGVISYCKTAEYISGYGDGTFRPAGTLTGYAFAKMLLGALGYKSNIEGFVDTGWTNNVARVGNVAGLFDRISFDGSAAVTRDQACQLALNTLKGTLVTYGGTTIINGGTAGQMTMQGTTATPITSNNRDINANIGRKDWYGGNNQGSDYLTLEFGEEHFKDLRLEHDRYDPAHDDFGRPSNEWSYKKVTIGTFPLPADKVYTTQVAHVEDTDSNKEKALDLRNFDLYADGGYSYSWNWQNWWNSNPNNNPTLLQRGTPTTLWMNGLEVVRTVNGNDVAYFAAPKDNITNTAHKVADIADFTDNGTLVEVYVSYVDADWITDVVVIQTQLMEVDKVASDYVALKQQEPDVDRGNPGSPVATGNGGTPQVGYNQAAIDVEVEDVKDNNEDCYAILKDLKAGDDIAVVPVTTDGGKTYEAAEVYVPETVSGAWTRVDTYGKLINGVSNRSAISITVGGTEYKIADWNDKMYDQTDVNIKATRKDVTLLMDKYGNALKAKGIGDTSGFMVIGNYYQSLVNGRISTFVHGWDINGTELDLNLGSNVQFQQHGATIGYGHELGELVTYTSDGVTGDADYALTHDDVDSVFPYLDDGAIVAVGADGKKTADGEKPNFEVKANNLRIPVSNSAAVTYTGTTPATAWPSAHDGVAPRDARHFSNSAVILNDIDAKLGDTPTTNTPDADFYTRYTFADNVKFIYVNYTQGEDEVDSVEFKSGRQNASYDELISKLPGNFLFASQVSIKDDKITSVVIKNESSDASLNRMLYVINYTGFNEYDSSTGRTGIGVLVARFTDGKFEDEVEMIVDKNLAIGAFATYSDTGATTINGKEIEHYYHVKNFTRHNSNPAVLFANSISPVKLVDAQDGDLSGKWSKYLLRLAGAKRLDAAGNATGTDLVADPDDDGVGAVEEFQSYVMSNWRSHDIIDTQWNQGQGIIWANDAYILNATGNKNFDKLDDVEDVLDHMKGEDGKFGTADDRTFEVSILFNEKPDSDDFRVSYLIVLKDEDAANSSGTPSEPDTPNDGSVNFGDGAGTPAEKVEYMEVNGTKVPFGTKLKAGDKIVISPNAGYQLGDLPANSGLEPVPGEPGAFIVTDPTKSLEIPVEEIPDYVEQISYTLRLVGPEGVISEQTLTVDADKVNDPIAVPTLNGYYTDQTTYTIQKVGEEYIATVNYKVDAAASVTEEVTTGTTPATGASADDQKTSIRNGDPGVYTVTASGISYGEGGLSGRPEDNRIFRWNSAHPQSETANASYTLTIDAAGEQGQGKVWKETTDGADVEAGTAMVFYVQVTSPGNSADSSVFHNKDIGTGTLKTAPLQPGDYCYQIEMKLGDMKKVIQSGTFSIEAEGTPAGEQGNIADALTIPPAAAEDGKYTEAEMTTLWTNIGKLPVGVYVAPELGSTSGADSKVPSASKIYTADAAASDCRIIVVDVGSQSTSATLKIFNSDGTEMWSETASDRTGGVPFLFQVRATELDDGSTYFYNSGSGTMTSTQLPTGTYTYQVTSGSALTLKVIQTGSFDV